MLFMASASTATGSTCAPAIGDYMPPTSPMSKVCLHSGSSTISTSLISGATGMWSSNCSQIGSGIPSLRANSTDCSLKISVIHRTTAGPNGYSAGFQPLMDDATNPPTLIGGKIYCYVSACTPELLAHEIGHALGLGHAASSGCDGQIMLHVNPGTNFTDACRSADKLWDGPSSSDVTPESGGGGGGSGAGVQDKAAADDPSTGGGGWGGDGGGTGSASYSARCCFPDGTCIPCG